MTRQIHIENSQIGAVGDQPHIEGGVHFNQQGQQVSMQTNVAGNLVVHPSLFDRLNTWRKVNHWRFAGALLAVLLLLMLTGTALAGAISPDIRQTLFLNGFWPRAFPAEQEGEVLIVIATFHHSGGVADTEPHEKIRRAIDATRAEVSPTNLRVAVAPTCLRADDRAGAQDLGARYGASLIIWGEDTGIEVRVNFYNRKQPQEVYTADVRIVETLRTQITAPSEYATFITQDLPAQLTFLSLFAAAQSYRAAGDYSAGVQAIEAAIALLSNSNFKFEGAGDAYFLLGWLYSEPLPNLSRALDAYNRVLELDPNNVYAYTNRGNVHAKLSEYDLALADFSRALELDPNHAYAYNNRACVYADLDEYALALAELNRALKVDPNYVYAYTNRGAVYAKLSEYALALADFNRALKLDPKDAYAYNSRGCFYADLDEYALALADFNRALKLDPKNAQAYNNRGNVYKALGKYVQALADYNRSLEFASDSAETYNNRGIVYHLLGEYDQALADYSRALELDPDLAATYNNRGITYYDLGEYDQALTDYNRALELDPTAALAYYNGAGAYAALADVARACAWLEQAIDLDFQLCTRADTDPAFDPIRNEPCFQALMDGAP